MIQAWMESIFDVLYLGFIIFTGFNMLKISKEMNNKDFRLFGYMAIILGFGDSFHLVPRAYALFTNGLEANAASLGIGKFITSITMTVFYVILYHFWKNRYKPKNTKILDYSIYLLAFIRIVLCLLPQNEWLVYNQPLSYGIYRNIPFALMGLLIILLFYVEAKKHQDKDFQFMWLAILLSFGFYVPVVLFSNTYPSVGILMIPKTLAYVWVVVMGDQSMKKAQKKLVNK